MCAWGGPCLLPMSEENAPIRSLLHPHKDDLRPPQARIGGIEVESKFNAALRFARSGQLSPAIATLQEIPWSSHSNRSATLLALCLRNSEDIASAISTADHAINLDPNEALAWLVKGSAEVMQGSYRSGEESLRQCVSLSPSLFEAWHFLGESLHAQSRWLEALTAYRAASRGQPSEIFNIGICMEHLGEFHQARQAYLSMQSLRPDRLDCLSRLAHVESMMCMFKETSRTCAHIESRLLQAKTSSGRDLAEVFPLTYLDVSEETKRIALENYSSYILSKSKRSSLPPPSSPCHPSPSSLRIAYISPDFGDHAVGSLVQDLFSSHNKMDFEIYGYSLRRHNDHTAEKIRNSFSENFRDCSDLSDDRIAHRIRSDRIDLLVDLGGFTNGSRPGVLAMRPAVKQVSWLGFIHAHEAPWLDGILLDEHLAPSDNEWPYGDNVIRLPGTMFPAGPIPTGVSDRSAFGIPEQSFVFASFNNSYKITFDLLVCWHKILERCSHSILMIYLPPYARSAFLSSWRRIGGDSNRLLVVDKIPMSQQACRAASCDLFLDTFQYQAGATAIGAIAAGLPLLTATGTSPLGRLGTSLNRFLGMEELICSSARDYVDRAIELAHAPSSMKEVREKMARNSMTSGLFDPARAATNIESVCRRLCLPRTETDGES